MHIKASRITNLTDARYFAAREVQFLGFNLEEGTEGFLDPIYMKAIREWVEGPQIVGEYRNTPVETIAEAVAFYGLDAVELSAAHIAGLDRLAGTPVLLRLDAGADPEPVAELLRQAAGKFQYAVLDFSKAGLRWEDLAPRAEAWRALLAEFPCLLHLDFEALTITALLEALGPAGISISGGEEERVGVKSFEEVEEVFEALLG